MKSAEEVRTTGGQSAGSVVLNCISLQFELVRRSEVVAALEFTLAGSHFDLARLRLSPAWEDDEDAARKLVTAVLNIVRSSSATASISCAYAMGIAQSAGCGSLVTPAPLAPAPRPRASATRVRPPACRVEPSQRWNHR